MKIHVKTMTNLEEVLVREIEEIGGREIEKGHRIVTFEGSMRAVYRANYELRTALRVLIPFHDFRVRDENDLYKKIQQVDWSEYLEVDQTFAIDATLSDTPKLTHSKYVALKTKDAIVDQFRDKFGKRPSVNIQSPDIRIHLHIRQGLGSLSLDSSGDSLHKRGYRLDAVEAPISEVLAAGMILLSGWDKKTPFLDPMCGSGTLLVEAARMAMKIPPQFGRTTFGFTNWPNFEESLWNNVVEKANKHITAECPSILGCDASFQAIRIAERNLEAANLLDQIDLKRKKFEKLEPPFESGMIVTNPPYDERLPIKDTEALYKMIGDRLKQHFAGYTAWIISSSMEGFKSFGLRPSRKIKLYNGPLECRFQKYELYAGSKKKKFQDA
ncbi:MAG: THUMP domain-containing protein [Bacteroidota bacterium]